MKSLLAHLAAIAAAPYVQAERLAARPGFPACLQVVVKRLGGYVGCNSEQVQQNLHASHDDVRRYLGTYLPRTVVELRTISGELYAHPHNRRALPQGRPLRVLDLGSGTGGAWLGLAYGLADQGVGRALEVVTVDGNAIALGQQSDLCHATSVDLGHSIDLQQVKAELRRDAAGFAADLQVVLGYVGGEFDVILVSKHLSEHYYDHCAPASGVVQAALAQLQTRLAECGHLIVLDVTMPVKGAAAAEYFPHTMAKEIATQLRQPSNQLQVVLPVPCALGMAACTTALRGGCFTKREFEYKNKANSVSKACYWVLARTAHAHGMVQSHDRSRRHIVHIQPSGEMSLCRAA